MTLSAWLLLYAFSSAAALHGNAPTPTCRCCSGIPPRGVKVVLRWNTSTTFRRSLSSCCSQARGSSSLPTSVADFRYLAAEWQESAARIVVSAFTNTDSRGSVGSAQQRLVEAGAIFLAEVAAIAAEIRQLLSADPGPDWRICRKKATLSTRYPNLSIQTTYPGDLSIGIRLQVMTSFDPTKTYNDCRRFLRRRIWRAGACSRPASRRARPWPS